MDPLLRFARAPASLAASLALLTALSLSTAAAQPEEPATADLPLRGLTPTELALIEPHLDRGPVLHALFRHREDEMPAIVLAMKMNATPDEVAAVVGHPEHYAEFMPALDSLEVVSRSGNQTAYRWQWQLALFQLSGRNVMTRYPGNARRGHRIDVLSTGGDLGTGRMSWRIRPDPNRPGGSIVVLSSRLDMRDANYLSDQMSSGGGSVYRSINIALTSVMMFGTQRRAEAPRTAPTDPLAPLRKPDLDINGLEPLLARGDLVFLELHGEALERVTALGRTTTDVARARAVMNDPEEFGRSLMHGSRAEIVERHDDHVVFRWGIPMPIIAVEGSMRLYPRDEGPVRVEGVSGSLQSGEWVFDTHALPHGEAVTYGWSRFDPAESARFIRRLIADDADFSHGLVMATQVMVVRSLRSRATRYVP